MIGVIAPMDKQEKRLVVASESILAELCNSFQRSLGPTMNIVADIVARYIINGDREVLDPFDPVTGIAYADFQVRRMTAIAVYTLHVRVVANTLSPEELQRAEALYRRVGVDPSRPHHALHALQVAY